MGHNNIKQELQADGSEDVRGEGDTMRKWTLQEHFVPVINK